MGRGWKLRSAAAGGWVLVAAAWMVSAGVASAQLYEWTGNVDSNWFNASNWSPSMPGHGEDAVSDLPSGIQPVINGGTVSVQDFISGLSPNSNANTTITLEGNTTVGSTNGDFIGCNPGSTGTVDIVGGNINWNDSNGMLVGFFGNGTLNISGGANVTMTAGTVGGIEQISNTFNMTSSVLLGTEAGVTGTMTVSGANWTLKPGGNGFAFGDGELQVGNMGSGVLNILNGGQVTTNSVYLGAGPQELVPNLSGNATVLVSGAGSTLNTEFIEVGSYNVPANLTIANGGAVNASNRVFLNNTTSVINLSNGTLQVGNVTQVFSGTMQGTGTLNGSLIVTYTGVLAPGTDGGLQVGAGNVALGGAGNVTLQATANFEIGGAGNYSSLSLLATGAVLTYGGNLTLNFDSAVTGANEFALFDFANGTETGDFGGVDLGGAYGGELSDSGGNWTGTSGGEEFAFNTTTGILTTSIATVPEPAWAGVLAGGLALLAGAGLRRARSE
jgi:T5SS/PEP-CTERM-associated repeat protein